MMSPTWRSWFSARSLAGVSAPGWRMGMSSFVRAARGTTVFFFVTFAKASEYSLKDAPWLKFRRILILSLMGGWVLDKFDNFICPFFLKGLAMYIGAVTLLAEANWGDGSLAIFSRALARPSG